LEAFDFQNESLESLGRKQASISQVELIFWSHLNLLVPHPLFKVQFVSSSDLIKAVQIS